MSTSIKAVLRPAQKDGLLPVSLRITAYRKHAYLSTGVAISEKFWNPDGKLENKNWVRGAHPEKEIYNGKIQKLMRAALKAEEANPGLSAEALRNLVRPAEAKAAPTGPDLLALLLEEVARREKTGHPRSAQKYASIRHKLQSFAMGIAHPKGRHGLRLESAEAQALRAVVTLPVSEFGLRRLRDYEQYLLALPNRVTTVQKELSFINTVLLRAVEEEVIEEAANPFKRFTYTHGKSRPKAKLSEEEVERLEALPVEVLMRPLRPGTHRKTVRGRLQARDCWLLQYYLMGSRIGDVLTLRWRHVSAEAVLFTEQKTGKVKAAPRHEDLDALLARLGEAQVVDREQFVLSYLDAAAWYTQFPADLSWEALGRQPSHRAKWVQLLKKIESATSRVNQDLEEVAALAGIEKKVSTHVSRHSFADRGRRRGVPASDMRDMLNHHSISQTESYYGQLEGVEVSQAARSIYSRK